MKDLKKMTYRELEQEVLNNYCETSNATPERKRALIRRNYEVMVEMDARWNAAEARRKGAVK